MRKITFLFTLLLICSMSVFSTRYLVQSGTNGAASWRAAGEGEILVDLSIEEINLNEWLTASFNGFTAGNEIWLAAGLYSVSSQFLIPANFTIYGGFDGTETSADDRVKGEEAWSFDNETIIDGGNNTTIFACNSQRIALFDGLTIKNGNTTANGGAMTIRADVVVRNCKFTNNNATGQGGAILMNGGGEIINSYFSNNSANMGGAANMSGTGPHHISGCIFENNMATVGSNKQGGAIRSQSGNAVIEKCIIRNNEAAGNGSAIYTQVDTKGANKIINCLIYANKTKVALYVRGASLYNCTVVDNEAGGAYFGNQYGEIYNSVFWGDSKTKAAVTGANSNEGAVLKNNALVTIPVYDKWTISDNITVDTLATEANYPYFTDPLNNNWTINRQSPLVDAADGSIENSPATDIIGITRPQGTAYDIGAYEYVNSPGTGMNDINNDFEYFVTDNELRLSGLSEGEIVTIYDITGTRIIQKQTYNNNCTVNLNQGIYIVRIANHAKKIIIK